MPGGRGECGARGRGLISGAPGRLRASASRHYDRGGRCIPGLGQAGAGNARGEAQDLRPPVGAGVPDRALLPRPRKPGLKLSLGDESSLWREPWWNADRRARPQRRVGASRLFVARTAPAGADISNASVGVPLPLFAGSESKRGDFVIAGLDPAIHAAVKLVQFFRC